MSKKVLSAIVCSALLFSLTACGNKTTTSSHKDEVTSSISKTHKKSKDKKSSNNSKKNGTKKIDSSQNDNLRSDNGQNEAASSSMNNVTDSNSKSMEVESNSDSMQRKMSAQDAKNIVKEHIGNKLNDAGINGKSVSGLPSISEIDGYTAVQNGVNDWTVSGNGHTYHVTATSVTGN